MTREGRDAAIRLECAALAGGSVDRARQLYRFVTGQADQTPKERILTALEDAGIK
jgi:hypothetical protein